MISLNENRGNPLDAMIVETLVTWIERSTSTITYGDLSKRIARKFLVPEPDPWRTFDAPLGRIQVTCDDLGLPCLPAIVVTKEKMEPGVGFASVHRSRHPEDGGALGQGARLARGLQGHVLPRLAEAPRQIRD